MAEEANRRDEADSFLTSHDRSPLRVAGLGCLLAAMLVAAPLMMLLCLALATNAVLMWIDPEPLRYSGVDPRARIMAQATYACILALLPVWCAWWAGTRLFFPRREPEGCIVASDCVTVFTPAGAIGLPLTEVTECRPIDYYDFVVETGAERAVSPGLERHAFKHPKHGLGIQTWSGVRLAAGRDRPLVLFVASDGRRVVLDTPDPTAVIAAVE